MNRLLLMNQMNSYNIAESINARVNFNTQYRTDEDYEPSPVPVLVYRSQLDLALSDFKLTGKGYVFEADEVLREDTRVAQNLSELNSDEIDSLFRLAATK